MSVNANNIIIRGNVRKTSCGHQHNFYYYFRNANKTLSQHQKCGCENHSGMAGVFFRQARGKVGPTATVLEFTEPSTAVTAVTAATAAPQATTGVYPRC